MFPPVTAQHLLLYTLLFRLIYYRPLLPKESTLELPCFTICANPHLNETALQLAGLNSNVWSFFNYEFGDTNFSTWPMKALINDSNLHEKTVFGLNEFVDLARFQLGDGAVHIVNVSELINDKYLKIKVKSQTSNFNTES